MRERGFTYIGLLILIAIIGIGLVALSDVASTQMKRDKEAQLLFVGDQYAKAIASYKAAAGEGGNQFPRSLDQLLSDPRTPTVRRHLRRLYPDPMTGKADWILVPSPGGGIAGVKSRSTDAPLKRYGFPADYEQFAKAATYGDWIFVQPNTAVGTGENLQAQGTNAPAKTPDAGSTSDIVNQD